MTLFVDTSVWSLAFRRDTVPEVPEVKRLREALVGGESVYTTGTVLQELLQVNLYNNTTNLIRERNLPYLFQSPQEQNDNLCQKSYPL